jgi:hypothetical protein
MQTPESPKWVLPFRFMAGMLGLIGIGGLVARLQSSWHVGGTFWIAATSEVALLIFGFLPRSIHGRYWIAVALLACTGLAFTIFQLLELASRGFGAVLLSGHFLLGGIYAVMLFDSVRGRCR